MIDYIIYPIKNIQNTFYLMKNPKMLLIILNLQLIHVYMKRNLETAM